jgi:putative ABC transport system permease protein
VVRLVMGRAAWLAGIGVAIGVLGAIGLGRSMQAILFDTNPGDPAILLGAGVLLGGIALMASWVPARRATRVNPVSALRGD